jgi:hypothetical protein
MGGRIMLFRILKLINFILILFYTAEAITQTTRGEDAPWIWQEMNIVNTNFETGFVGINTLNPNYTFDVLGDINGSGYLINGTPVGIWNKIEEHLFYDSGFIGIGTNSPSSLLTLRGEIDQLEVWGANSNFQMSLWGIDDSHSGELTFNLNTPFSGEANPGYYFNLNNQTKLFLDPEGILKLSGKMGIGSMNPVHPFELFDDDKPHLKVATGIPGDERLVFLGVEKNMNLSSLGNIGDALLVAETPGNLIISNRFGGLKFGVGAGSMEQEIMTMDLAGIGIGTQPDPTSILTVNGAIKSREIIVTETGWSDYVFQEDYMLPTLDEVEQYIQQKRHLRDIPSSQQVAKDGVNLGEMQACLLQKIEELTLYVIQQNKRIQILESQLQNN